MKLFFSKDYVGARHAFDTTRKSEWIANSLQSDPVSDVCLAVPKWANISQLEDVHSKKYIDAVRTGEPRGLAESNGFSWDEGIWAMARASTGGVIDAVTETMTTGRASGSLSSGLHHASRESGSGFCTFNGLVAGSHRAIALGAKRVLILDLDAHCGGGTHDCIKGDRRIVHVDISTSGFDRYSEKQVVIRDSEEYLPTIEWTLAKLKRIDCCIYNAGMDPFGDGAIGGLKGITSEMLATREAMVFDWFKSRGIPIAFTLAGGYTGLGLSQAGLVELHRHTIQAAVV